MRHLSSPMLWDKPGEQRDTLILNLWASLGKYLISLAFVSILTHHNPGQLYFPCWEGWCDVNLRELCGDNGYYGKMLHRKSVNVRCISNAGRTHVPITRKTHGLSASFSVISSLDIVLHWALMRTHQVDNGQQSPAPEIPSLQTEQWVFRCGTTNQCS